MIETDALDPSPAWTGRFASVWDYMFDISIEVTLDDFPTVERHLTRAKAFVLYKCEDERYMYTGGSSEELSGGRTNT